MTTITLDLPQELYQYATEMAESSHQSVEEVVMQWIQPPLDETALQSQLNELAERSTVELVELVHLQMSSQNARRLQELLDLQQERLLSGDEQREAANLVRQQELQTLRKAKALYLLKQRNALPPEFAEQ